MKKIVLVILCVLLFTGCSKKEKSILDFKEEYESYNGTGNVVDVTIDEEVEVKYLSPKQTIQFLENGTGILYFGYPTCPWCRNVVGPLFELAKENQLPVYYMNPREFRGTKDKNFNKILELLDEHLQIDDEGKKKLYVPDVYFIKDGKIIGHHLGTVESQINPNIPLLEEEKQELKQIFNQWIGQVK